MLGGRSALLGAAGGGLGYGNWTGNYSDVSLLLRNGTPGPLIPLDESPSPKALTTVGNAGFSTSIKQYGTSSMVFDGSGDYFSSPTNAGFDFGTGDFTIECWVNLNTLATGQVFVAYAANVNASTLSFYLNRSSSGVFNCLIGASGVFYAANVNPVISTGTWYHVAGVRSGGQLRCYVNGVGGTAVSANVSVNAASGRSLNVGVLYQGFEFTNGYIDDLRITKGVARYTANFTPPTAELPANVTDDPSYNSVSLLLRNGTLKLIPLDESPSPKALTTVGNAAISTSIKQYGTSSMVFDGSGDYFSSPLNADFDFGTGDFTIECWVNLNTLATDQAFVTYAAALSGSVTSFSLDRLTSGGAFRCYIYSGSSLYTATVSPVISTGTWYHVAGVRSGGQLRCYVNGVGGTAVSANVSVNAAADRILTVGSFFTSLRFTNGYIDDLRITKGVARYTKNFLPPPAELPAI